MRTIKEIRKLYNMSQSEFAKRFNLSVRTLQQWEQNISEPSNALLMAIYEIYLREHESTNYEILYKNTVVAEVLLSKDKKDIISFIKTKNKLMIPFKYNINIIDFYTFLKGRCYEDERDNLKSILDAAGLKHNDPYEWIKKSHGVTWEDYFWIRFKNEKITWEEVRIRE